MRTLLENRRKDLNSPLSEEKFTEFLHVDKDIIGFVFIQYIG